MTWNDPRRKVSELREQIRRLRARAERWGAPETAAALAEAFERAEADLPPARTSQAGAPSPEA